MEKIKDFLISVIFAISRQACFGILETVDHLEFSYKRDSFTDTAVKKQFNERQLCEWIQLVDKKHQKLWKAMEGFNNFKADALWQLYLVLE